jgi:hypothetical protein
MRFSRLAENRRVQRGNLYVVAATVKYGFQEYCCNKYYLFLWSRPTLEAFLGFGNKSKVDPCQGSSMCRAGNEWKLFGIKIS